MPCRTAAPSVQNAMQRAATHLPTSWRAACALAAVVWLLAVAGCGGGSSTSAPASSDAAGSGGTQAARLDRSATRFVNATGTFLTRLNRCVVSKDKDACVRKAATPADAVVKSTRKDVVAMKTKAPAACADGLDGVAEAISQVTDDLRPMTTAALTGDFRASTRLGPDVQNQLRGFVAAIRGAQQACTA